MSRNAIHFLTMRYPVSHNAMACFAQRDGLFRACDGLFCTMRWPISRMRWAIALESKNSINSPERPISAQE